MELDEKRIAKIFKALCDENRVKILKMLTGGEKCACVLLKEIDIVQSTLSSHMKILCESGLVEERKEGKWKHYRLSQEGFDKAVAVLLYLKGEKNTENDQPCCGK